MKHLRLLVCGMTWWLAATAGADAGEPLHSADPQHHWPQWRGPQANGVAPHGDPPITWSESENVRFKVEIPGNALASPVVWGDQIFILTTVAADDAAYQAARDAAAEKLAKREWPPEVTPVAQRFVVMALSRHDGSVLWQRTAIEKVPHESHYIDSSWASASPLTDGQRLFAHFGSNGLFAYDLEGELLWQVDLGDMATRRRFGEGSSPALQGDTLVVNWDHEGDSFLVALEAATAKERWRVERPDEVTTWATPLIVEHGGRWQAVVPGTGRSRGYDLTTGEEIWSADGMTVNTIPSPVHRDGLVYLASGYRGNALQAVSLADARGDITDTAAIRWSHDRHTPYVPSLLLYDDKVYFLKHNRNIFSCLDAATGEVLFTEQRLPGISNVYASPVGAAGRVYVVGRDGKAVVLEHGGAGEPCEFKVLAENSLDDGFDASPAIVGDEMYLRGRRFLYALAREGDGEAETQAKGEATARQSGNLFLTGAKIVDPVAREVRQSNLLIEDGRIAGSPEAPPAGFSGKTLDLEGRWIIPGLADLHTHSYGNMAPGNAFDAPGTAVVAERVLYAGVTAFLDLFGREEMLYDLRAKQRRGEAGGADLFASLSCLTATEGHCTEYGVPTRTMDSPQEARNVVNDLAKKKPDVVKIVYSPTGRMPSIDAATLQVAIATAKEHGLKTVIHVNTWQDARDAIEAGASAITHVPSG
ncbi:MAG: PQQ-binding-like beta-propeller repeat protein, partial [Acidobacteriota bacterium]